MTTAPTLLSLLLLLLLSGCHATGGSAERRLSAREEALVALQRGDGARLLPKLEQLYAASPGDLQLARMLAEAHVQAGSSEALLTRLAPLDTAPSHYMQGLVRFARAGEAGGPAVLQFRRAAEIAPAEAELHYRLGLALVESEQYEAAVGPLRTAISLAPRRTGWQLPLAKALARSGDSQGAVAAIRAGISEGPTPAEVAQARALMEQLTDPFSSLPTSARPKVEKAIQWLEVADVPQEAIVELEELRQEFPDLAIVHTLLGLSHARLDDLGRAVEELNAAIEKAPADGKNHLYLAQLYLARQRAKAGEEHLLRAVQLNPVLDEAWTKLGDLALDRQDYVTARRDYGLASALAPEDVGARGKLALVYQKERNWPAADRELKTMLSKDPDSVAFMLRLGVLHTERFLSTKDRLEKETAAREAAGWLRKVLDVQPENALASRALEQVKGR